MNKASCLLNEKDLLLKTAQGDETAFAALYNFYQPLLATHIYRITRSMAITEEITQDVFLKIWINKEILTTLDNFRSYLTTVSRNAALNELRNLRRKAARHELWQMENVAITVSEEPQSNPALHSFFDDAIALLPQRQRNVYVMARYQRLKYAEIAQQMNLTRGTVKRYLQLATASIANHLRAQMVNECILLIGFFFLRF